MIDFLAALLQTLGGETRRREAFELRAVLAPPGSAAHRDDFSHCWALQNANVRKGAHEVTFAWRRGPDGSAAEPVTLGTVPLMDTAPLEGIPWPSQRPSVSGQVSWTEADGTRRTMPLHSD